MLKNFYIQKNTLLAEQLNNLLTNNKEKYKYLEPSSLKKDYKKNKWKSLVG